MMAVMENIVQCKMGKPLVDADYEITYPEGMFEVYTMENLINIKVKRINQLSLTDLQLIASTGWYQTIVRTTNNTCYNTVTHNPQPTSCGVGIPGTQFGGGTLQAGSSENTVDIGCVLTVPSSISSLTLYPTINYIQGGSNPATNVFGIRFNGVQASRFDRSIVGSNWPHTWANPNMNNIRWAITLFTLDAAITVISMSIHASWHSYQTSAPYNCPTYSTNATFKSENFIIESNRTNIVIENNQQRMTRLRLYNTANTSLGDLITNQNVRTVALNDRKGQTVNIDLNCNTVGAGNTAVNWFTRIFLREEHYETLEDIQYEIDLLINHDLTETQVNTTVTTDNQNGNIYKRRIAITGIPWNDNRLRKFIRPDFKNVRLFYSNSETENYILPHSMNDNGTLVLEHPDQFLKNTQIAVKLAILPMDYEHKNDVIDTTNPVLNVLDIFYEFPDFNKK
jgi:hypothetical protein